MYFIDSLKHTEGIAAEALLDVARGLASVTEPEFNMWYNMEV